jgi:ribosomal protein L33
MNLRYERYSPSDMGTRVCCPECQERLYITMPRGAMTFGRVQVTCDECGAHFYVVVGDIGRDRIAVSVEPSPH